MGGGWGAGQPGEGGAALFCLEPSPPCWASISCPDTHVASAPTPVTKSEFPITVKVAEFGVGCHFLFQCMKVKRESAVTQSCLTLRHLMDYSLPGSSALGIFQARVLECIATAFSN